MITVIVPVFKESVELVQECIARLLTQQGFSQVIVCISQLDPGMSEIRHLVDDEKDPRLEYVLLQKKGRAIQMNAAVLQARASVLLFIHADTVLPDNADNLISNATKTASWGRFDVALDSNEPAYRVISWWINKRSRLSGIATGDQAIFTNRELFDQVGGFADQALMEDIEFSRSAKKRANPVYIKEQVITSARRWQKNGLIKTIGLMWFLRALYWLGVPANTLASLYSNVR